MIPISSKRFEKKYLGGTLYSKGIRHHILWNHAHMNVEKSIEEMVRSEIVFVFSTPRDFHATAKP